MSLVGLRDVLLHIQYIPAARMSHHAQWLEQAHSLLLHALPPDRLSFELSQIKVPFLEDLQDAVCLSSMAVPVSFAQICSHHRLRCWCAIPILQKLI